MPGPSHTIREHLSVTASGYTNFPTNSKNTQLVNFNEGQLDLVRGDRSQNAFVPIGLHFHTPSEHTFYGEHFDLELHIVHKYKENGKLGAVLGIMFEESEEDNQLIDSLLYAMEGGNVDLGLFISKLDYASFYSYDGSLTSPPCTEGIKWTLLADV